MRSTAWAPRASRHRRVDRNWSRGGASAPPPLHVLPLTVVDSGSVRREARADRPMFADRSLHAPDAGKAGRSSTRPILLLARRSAARGSRSARSPAELDIHRARGVLWRTAQNQPCPHPRTLGIRHSGGLSGRAAARVGRVHQGVHARARAISAAGRSCREHDRGADHAGGQRRLQAAR